MAAITLASLAACQDDSYSNRVEHPTKQHSGSAREDKRIDLLIEKYSQIREKIRNSNMLDGYLENSQKIYVLEQEIGHLEPLALDMIKQKENALDEKRRVRENSREADAILNVAK